MPGVWRMHAGVVRAELSTHADLKFTTQHVGGRKLAEIDFRNRRPWHSSPIIPMARDVAQNVCSAAAFHCPLGKMRLFLMYPLAGNVIPPWLVTTHLQILTRWLATTKIPDALSCATTSTCDDSAIFVEMAFSAPTRCLRYLRV